MDFMKCNVEEDCLYVMACLIQRECDIVLAFFDVLCIDLEKCESRNLRAIEESVLIYY